MFTKKRNNLVGHKVGGRFLLMEQLGEGAYSRTYLAKDKHNYDTLCALKYLVLNTNDTNILNKARELFEREAETLERLSSAQNHQIPEFIDHFAIREDLYIVQEYINGPTLRKEFKQKGGMTEKEVQDILQQVLKALEFIHDQGVIHRDIKPDNLIRRTDRSRTIVLIDFGAVKTAEAELTQSKTGIYTLGYAPLEQLQGNITKSVDIYALGMTAIEALTGLPVNKIKDPHHDSINWPQGFQASKGLIEILEKMVADNVSLRYQRAEDVLNDLVNYNTMPYKPRSTSVGNTNSSRKTSKTKVVSPDTHYTSENITTQNTSSGNWLLSWILWSGGIVVTVVGVVAIASVVGYQAAKGVINTPKVPTAKEVPSEETIPSSKVETPPQLPSKKNTESVKIAPKPMATNTPQIPAIKPKAVTTPQVPKTKPKTNKPIVKPKPSVASTCKDSDPDSFFCES